MTTNAEEIAKLWLNSFENVLGKKGKPQQDKEWTKMAAIVQESSSGKLEVITIATGTKCIGEKERSANGFVLNDSHAEILARRLFLKYLYAEISNASNDQPSIFERQQGSSYKLKDGYKYHLFTTDVPCGDAFIFPKNEQSSNIKRKHDSGVESSCKPSKLYKCDEELKTEQMSGDINRTGAKCVPLGDQDLLQTGENFHVTGALRIKPGRGNRTISMSCSDKIMKWCTLGVQGGLLYNFIKKPLYLSSIIINNACYDSNALCRALSFRGRNSHELEIIRPSLHQTNLMFADGKETLEKRMIDTNKISPSPVSLLWCPSCNIYEVANNGRKHGMTKKNFNTLKARTAICKHVLYGEFQKLSKESVQKSYYDCKNSNEEYRKRKELFFNVFNDWIRKPRHFEEFK